VNVPLANISLIFVANGLIDENASALQSLSISSSKNGSRCTSSTSGSRHSPIVDQPPPDTRLSYDPTRILSVPEVITRAIDHETVPDAVVMKFSWQPAEKDRVEAEALQRCSGRFGTPSFLCALRIGDNYGFMPPTSDEVEGWSCFKQAERPKGLERRALIATVCADSGASLECCKAPWQLGRALLDCQLGERDSYSQRFLNWTLIPHQVGWDYCSAIASIATSAWGISCSSTNLSCGLHSSRNYRLDMRSKAWASWSASTRRPAKSLEMYWRA